MTQPTGLMLKYIIKYNRTCICNCNRSPWRWIITQDMNNTSSKTHSNTSSGTLISWSCWRHFSMSCRPPIMKFLWTKTPLVEILLCLRIGTVALSSIQPDSQFLVEDCLTAGLEVADDDSQLSDILDKFLQMFLKVVEFFSHITWQLLNH